MVTIAMTREMGTRGKDVAQGLADALNLKVIHSELVEHDLARDLGVQESAVHHYLEGNATLLERWRIDKTRLSHYSAEEMLKLARDGNLVIRGWGAVGVLRAIPHVLRVRVCANMEYRERVIMERMGLNERSAARSEIKKNDAAHTALMRGFFGVNWENPQLYHVVLNTGCVPIDACVSAIRRLTEEPAFQESDASLALLADKLTEARADRELKAHSLDYSISGGPEISASKGRVTLSGIIGPGGDLPGAVEAIRAIEGVTAVDNQLRRVALHYGS